MAVGRSVVVVAVVAAEQASEKRQGGGGSYAVTLLIVLGVLTIVTLVMSIVRYMYTRWKLDGTTLRIETGLFKRDARQLPLARIQAVDVVKPVLARIFGLAELKIRLAGGGRSGGRLAYLSEPVAFDLRARLLAGHHGLDQSTPEPAERPITRIVNSELIISAILSSVPGLVVGGVVVAGLFIASAASGGAATAGAGTLLALVIGFGRNIWRRISEQYGFSVALAPDGIRVQRGLLSTVNETIPFARVQAVRKVQPLTWRLFGWCRLEVDVAGSPGQEQGTRSSRVTKALLPVGRYDAADALLVELLGLRQFPLTSPPPRARWKSPFSYHFLAAGTDGSVVASSTGRAQKVTVWIPLEKVQSVRRVQGPVQRALHLATVHVDAAGRRARAELRDRDVTEADTLFQQLVLDSRAARRRTAPPTNPASPTGRRPAPPAQPASTLIEQYAPPAGPPLLGLAPSPPATGLDGPGGVDGSGSVTGQPPPPPPPGTTAGHSPG